MTKIPWDKLRRVAREARASSHAPYSGFNVGAAVQGLSGKIYDGANIEVSSYGLTICAERLAVFKAVQAGEQELVAVAILADTTVPCPPCGACRQVLHDFGSGAQVLLEQLDGDRELRSIESLLPGAFTPAMLLDVTRRHHRQLLVPGIDILPSAEGEEE